MSGTAETSQLKRNSTTEAPSNHSIDKNKRVTNEQNDGMPTSSNGGGGNDNDNKVSAKDVIEALSAQRNDNFKPSFPLDDPFLSISRKGASLWEETAPLRGVVVCVTGLPPEQKTRLHRLVQQLGGKFTRELNSAENTHLVASQAQGAKYEMASSCSNKICIVTPSWIDACAVSRSRVDEGAYRLDHDTTNTSVTKVRRPKSGIVTDVSSRSARVAPPAKTDPPSFSIKQQLEEQLKSKTTRTSLFQSCRFFLMGFSDDLGGTDSGDDDGVKMQLGRLIRRGRGTIYWDLNEMITHIVVVDVSGSSHAACDSAHLLSRNHPNRPALIAPSWIVACWKKQFMVSITGHAPQKTTSASRRLSKKRKSGSIERIAADDALRSKPPPATVRSCLFRGCVFVLVQVSPSLSPSSSGCLVEFDKEELESKVLAHGGKMLSQPLVDAVKADFRRSKESGNHDDCSLRRTCYIVSWGGDPRPCISVHPLVPQVQRQELCDVVYVTPVWLETCLAEQAVVKPGAMPQLFQPLQAKWPWRRMCEKDDTSGVRVSITGFVGPERNAIMVFLKALGVPFDETLKSNNTHLIAKAASGPKYQKAMEWNCHVVSASWLYQVAQHGYNGQKHEKFPLPGKENAFACESSSSLIHPEKFASVAAGAKKPPPVPLTSSKQPRAITSAENASPLPL